MKLHKFFWEERKIWDQLRNITSSELISALKRSGWFQDTSKSAILVFRHPNGKRVTIHEHPNKTYGGDLLKSLLESIGWSREELIKLKLIKKV